MATSDWPEKHPWEILNYGVDWSARLNGASITGVSAELNYGSVALNDPFASAFEGAIQSVWVSGGVSGRQSVRCRAFLDNGERLEEIVGFTVL